jgi:AmmeMemoRadiSam system protein B
MILCFNYMDTNREQQRSMSNDSIQYPTLRPVDARPFQRGGQYLIALRDPLGLSDKTLFVPQELGPMLGLMDGTRDARGLSASLAVRYGVGVTPAEIEQILIAFDQVYLLDNTRFKEAKIEALSEFRNAQFRAPVLAGGTYPENPDELRTMLKGFLEAAELEQPLDRGRGLISPHIDYTRGGPVYAKVWGSAKDFVQAADLAIVFGTDHSSPIGRLTLTLQHYATPFGVLPTEQGVVQELAESLGEEQSFDQELYHRHEHSIELAATWLHFIRDEEPIKLVPILCGTFERFFGGETDPEDDIQVRNLVDTLRSVQSSRNSIVLAAADMSHVGPAFGGNPLDVLGHAQLGAADEGLLEQICAGDAKGFYEAVRNVGDVNNVCGLAPIYLTMLALSPVKGTKVAYDRCPADEGGTSIVSICGVVFH